MKTRYYATITLTLPDELRKKFGGDVIAVNHQIPDGLFTKAQLQRLIDKGWAEPFDTKPPEEEPKPSLTVTETKTEVEPAGEVPNDKNWTFNPADLTEKSLEELNMLARDHAAKQGIDPPKPFADLEDAIVFMTSEA